MYNYILILFIIRLAKFKYMFVSMELLSTLYITISKQFKLDIDVRHRH